MNYKIGEKIKLWKITPAATGTQTAQVTKEVIITITEMKKNVPGEFSGEVKDGYIGYKAIGDDGNEYEQFWFSYPEGFGAYGHIWERFYDYDFTPTKGEEIDYDFYYNSCMAFNDAQKADIKIEYNNKETLPFGTEYQKCDKHAYFFRNGRRCLKCVKEGNF